MKKYFVVLAVVMAFSLAFVSIGHSQVINTHTNVMGSDNPNAQAGAQATAVAAPIQTTIVGQEQGQLQGQLQGQMQGQGQFGYVNTQIVYEAPPVDSPQLNLAIPGINVNMGWSDVTNQFGDIAGCYRWNSLTEAPLNLVDTNKWADWGRIKIYNVIGQVMQDRDSFAAANGGKVPVSYRYVIYDEEGTRISGAAIGTAAAVPAKDAVVNSGIQLGTSKAKSSHDFTIVWLDVAVVPTKVVLFTAVQEFNKAKDTLEQLKVELATKKIKKELVSFEPLKKSKKAEGPVIGVTKSDYIIKK